MAEIDLKPTESMASNAERGLELREKHGKGGTAIGVARARDIKNRANLSPETVRRMHAFFNRHEKNKSGGEDDAGYIAWLLWGGDSGRSWAASKVKQLDRKEENGMSDTYKEINARLGALGKSKFAEASDRYGEALMKPVTAANAKAMERLASEAIKHAKKVGDDDLLELAEEVGREVQALRSRAARPGAKATMAAGGNKIDPVMQDVVLSKMDKLVEAINTVRKYIKKGEPDIAHTALKMLIQSAKSAEVHMQAFVLPRRQTRDESSRPGAKAKMDKNAAYIEYANLRETTSKLENRIARAPANDKPQLMAELAKQVQRMKELSQVLRSSRPGAKAEMMYTRPPRPKRLFPNKESQAKEYANHIAQLRTHIRGKAGEDAVEVLLKKAEKQLAVLNIPVAGDFYADAVRAAYAHGIFKGARPGAKATMATEEETKKLIDRLILDVVILVRNRTYTKAERYLNEVRRLASASPNLRSDRFIQGHITDLQKEINDGKADLKRKGIAYTGRAQYRDLLRPPVFSRAKEKASLADACWKGYEAVGTKQKDGKTVPNCVPKDANAIREGSKVSAGEDAVSRKIRKLMDEGKPQKQAVAIALDLERRGEL